MKSARGETGRRKRFKISRVTPLSVQVRPRAPIFTSAEYVLVQKPMKYWCGSCGVEFKAKDIEKHLHGITRDQIDSFIKVLEERNKHG